MNLSTSLRKRSCPVCLSTDDSHTLFEENIDESILNNGCVFQLASHGAASFRCTSEWMQAEILIRG